MKNLFLKNKFIKIIILILIIILLFTIISNLIVVLSTKNLITISNDQRLENADCILILGAGVWGDKPSPMLEDRLLTGLELYKNNVSKKIIVSGEHSKDDYDEVNVMKNYLIEHGVNSEDIFMDHAGISTYDSIYRAKVIFGIKKIIIVTQKYHLYRALYIAKNLDLYCYGINSDPREYSGQINRDIREILARTKDFVKSLIKPQSKYLGEQISITANGNITKNRNY